MGLPKYYSQFDIESEIVFKNKILSDLRKDFIIVEECRGTHLSGKQLRIDAIIKPKDISDWKNKEIAFGLEFKSPSNLKSFGGQLGFIKQCIDYSYTDFENFGFIPILSCPRIELDETYSGERSLTTIRHLLNQFLVGEMDYTHRGLSIIFAEHHFIWQDSVVNEGKRWALKKHFGSK